eukprot:Selendium_serpulae@DN5850_c1_g1_i1.p1
MSPKRIFVTGGNAGVGLALCKQLCSEHNAIVYLGSRNAARGEAAVADVKAAVPTADVRLVAVDVADDNSVLAAAQKVKNDLPAGESLYAVVNNAGTGLGHGTSPSDVINVNLNGPKRVCDAFIPLINQPGGRLVNVGSGAGPSFVNKQTEALQKKLCSTILEWSAIEGLAKEHLAEAAMGGYGLSKALLTCYTMLLAKQYPGIHFSCSAPGFIATGMTKNMGAATPPEKGTVCIKHCLFSQLPSGSSGWFWGCDALRSPLHFMRNPGEPEFDGKYPWD